MSAIVVKQKRSSIGQPKKQRLVLRALGLRKIGATNKLKDTNCIRGMVNKVKHLVEYSLVNE